MTKEKFRSYLLVQYGGQTNMFDVDRVIELSDFELTREDCLDIMKNYESYSEKWPEVKDEVKQSV